jgi:hypothetical protein
VKGMSLLWASLGIDPEAIKADMAGTVAYVRETLGKIGASLSRIEQDTAYTRVAVDRLYSAVTGGPPADTATALFALKTFEENPELEGAIYAELTAPRAEVKLNG